MKLQCNKINMRKWISALRSDKFQQITQMLSNGVGFCVQGVACEIAYGENVCFKTMLLNNTMAKYDGHCGWMPTSVRIWLGIHGQEATDELDLLARMNDFDIDFDTIADRLEDKFDVAEVKELVYA
jgi:hypothetical protein